LIRHWPLAAAPGARDWVETNVRLGLIDEVVAHLRFTGIDPELALDFTFSGLESTYLKDMSPIREARGRGALTLDTFDLIMDAGEVEPVPGAPVRLDGSVVHMPDVNADQPPGEISVRATGPTASILTLIDEEPLNLTRKLGLEPGSVSGESSVTANLQFPLINALLLEDVKVDSAAVLRDLRLPFRIPNGQVLDVAGASADLRASTASMHLAGDIMVDGQAMNLDWTENYGQGSNQRDMTFKGAATPALLARFGIDDSNFRNGSAPMELQLTQSGAPDYTFRLGADIGPAEFAVPELGWTKPPGDRGRLEASGTYGDTIRIDSFDLDTDDLKASGAAEVGEGGYIRTARINRAQYLGMADVAAQVSRGPKDAFQVVLTGSRVDLAVLDTLPEESAPGAAPGATVPIVLDFNIDEMQITPRAAARPATGTFRRNAANLRTARLEGLLAGQVPFAADYSKSGDEPGTVEVTSAQAGELLAAAQMFAGARGGDLKLKAVLAPSEGVDMTGLARITDVIIHGSGTFTSILDEGGVKDAASAAEKGGLFFDSVRLPFESGGGVLTLGDTTAKGKLLAVKFEGTVDENKDEVDLVGVISPAYALTGLLDSIPVLSTILSGGKGEGVFAMTFKVQGPTDNPEFTVNPLTLLAPGILRNVFSGRNRRPDDKFMEQLNRDVD
jgi:hypothetical protein